MRKDMFVIDPPTEETPGRYLLIVSRGTVFSSSTTAFAVDRLEFNGVGEKVDSIRGIQNNKIIVEFSPDSSYIMMDRGLARSTNMTELEIADRRATEEHKKVMDAEFPPGDQGAVAVTEDGRSRINTQGYL